MLVFLPGDITYRCAKQVLCTSLIPCIMPKACHHQWCDSEPQMQEALEVNSLLNCSLPPTFNGLK